MVEYVSDAIRDAIFRNSRKNKGNIASLKNFELSKTDGFVRSGYESKELHERWWRVRD